MLDAEYLTEQTHVYLQGLVISSEVKATSATFIGPALLRMVENAGLLVHPSRNVPKSPL